MNRKGLWQHRRKRMFVIVPASASTWAVAFARRLIPGALFETKMAAISYALLLASSAGLDSTSIKVLGNVQSR